MEARGGRGMDGMDDGVSEEGVEERRVGCMERVGRCAKMREREKKSAKGYL